MNALYLHIPFCRRKCPYCDFFSLEQSQPQLADYPDLLAQHVRLAARRQDWRAPLSTVFFGGGTPSLLSAGQVGAILEVAAREFGLDAAAEITLEANPGTLTRASLLGYRQAGINRLSLGVQSLVSSNLHFLERLHGPEEARRAVDWAREAGFDNLSLDLMFALPGQSLAALEQDVADFLALAPDHLSCYGLSLEEGTAFYQRLCRGELTPADEERAAEAFLFLDERLSAAGFEHYEIANYARPGQACRHNQRYWQRLPYLGVGAGAHSFFDQGWGERWAVPGDLDLYRDNLAAQRPPAQCLEVFDRQGAMAETLYLGLRTATGVDDEVFRNRFGLSVAEAFPEALRRNVGYLEKQGAHWRYNLRGWLLFDHLIAAFL